MQNGNARALGLAGVLAVAGALVSLAATAGSTLAEQRPGVLPLEGPVQLQRAATGELAVLVLLARPSTSEVYASELAARGPGAVPDIAARTRDHRQLVQHQQERFLSVLRSRSIRHRPIYKVQRALNAVALHVAPADLAALRTLPEVLRVEPLETHETGNSTSVPFINAPAVWENTLGLPFPATGAGVRIAIIDTGVDYLHAMFGGSGALVDYQANDRTVVADGFFPTARVVGGWDFAGDAYDGSNTAVEDPDPMDCNGHGSHVAGSAAGGGVNADGSAFAGPYDTAVPFGSLKIGPGVAPQAQIYAFRVFGCDGSTQLTNLAIDRALDPNDDGDLSDHVDVINMSLGSGFGSAFSSSALAADNAAAAGVVVVASAGNSGDVYFITGSPGSGERVVSVASIADDGVPGVRLVIDAPAPGAGAYPAVNAVFTDPVGSAPPAASGQSAEVVLAVDASGTTSDACEVLVNAALVAGRFALVDRGTCNFSVKLDNVNAAGAVGMVVANNSTDATLVPMVGAALADVAFPSVFVGLDTGNLIKAALGAGSVTLTLDDSFGNADVPSSFTSRGPRRSVGGTGVSLKPDLAAPGSLITSALTGIVCADTAGNPNCIVAGSEPLTISGTSMAAPHVAGMAGLLRQLHPDWPVEEVKAALVNGSTVNANLGAGNVGLRFGPSRVGAGRLDAAVAATAPVTAAAAEGIGATGVSFDLEPVAPTSVQKRIRVSNHDAVDHTYTVTLDPVLDGPGMAFSLPAGGTLQVPANSTVEFPVQFDATPALMDRARDPTVAASLSTAVGTQSRHFLSEESALVALSEGAELRMRVPVYAAVRPHSALSAAAVLATGGNASGSSAIALSGTDVCTGTEVAGPDCTGTFPPDVVSLVSALELAAVSPRSPTLAPDFADLRHVGVGYDAANDLVLFGISTWGEWSTPASDVSFEILVDLDEDGTPDSAVVTFDPGTLTGATAQDVFLSGVVDLGTDFINGILPLNLFNATVESNVFGNQVVLFGVPASTLGLTVGDRTFRWRVNSCPGSLAGCEHYFGFTYDQVAGPLQFDAGAPGLAFSQLSPAVGMDGTVLAVDFNSANLAANGSLGALLLHHHNTSDNRAEVVLLEGTASADLALSATVSNDAPAVGGLTTLTLTASNLGAPDAGPVQVAVELPAGLAHVTDSGAGAFDPATGLWSMATLPGSDDASLQLLLEAGASGPAPVRATIAAGAAPLDPNPANDVATVEVAVQPAADLSITLSADQPSVAPLGDMGFTLTLANAGPDTALNVRVSEVFTTPGLAAAAPHSFAASAGSYDPGTGIWSLASRSATAPAAATLSLTFTAPATDGVVELAASASADTADADATDNSANASVAVGNGIFRDGFEDP